jgi:rubrerythrin
MAERSDRELLEDLLAHEHRLLSAYGAALRRDAVEAELGVWLRDHEREHVRAIQQTLAARGERNPRATAPPPELNAALRSRESFARYAMELEGQTVDAYSSAVAAIRDPGLRQPLGSIMACTAAHAVALRDLLGERLLLP